MLSDFTQHRRQTQAARWMVCGLMARTGRVAGMSGRVPSEPRTTNHQPQTTNHKPPTIPTTNHQRPTPEGSKDHSQGSSPDPAGRHPWTKANTNPRTPEGVPQAGHTLCANTPITRKTKDQSVPIRAHLRFLPHEGRKTKKGSRSPPTNHKPRTTRAAHAAEPQRPMRNRPRPS